MPEECSVTPEFNGVFLLFWGLSFPQFQTLPRDGSGLYPGGFCSSCAASGKKSQWDLAQAELGFVFPSNLLRFNFLHSSVSLLRSFGPISVTSEMDSWNNLDIFVQTRQH